MSSSCEEMAQDHVRAVGAAFWIPWQRWAKGQVTRSWGQGCVRGLRVSPAWFFLANPQLVPAPCCSPGAEAQGAGHFCRHCTLLGPTAGCQLPWASPIVSSSAFCQCRGHCRMSCPFPTAVLTHVCNLYVVSLSHS